MHASWLRPALLVLETSLLSGASRSTCPVSGLCWSTIADSAFSNNSNLPVSYVQHLYGLTVPSVVLSQSFVRSALSAHPFRVVTTCFFGILFAPHEILFLMHTVTCYVCATSWTSVFTLGPRTSLSSSAHASFLEFCSRLFLRIPLTLLSSSDGHSTSVFLPSTPSRFGYL